MFPKKTYKKRKPSLASRGRFSNETIEDILDRDNYRCVVCGGNPDDIHHVKYKSKGGRNVLSNGVALCRNCHNQAHSSNKLRKELEQRMINLYGESYFKDEYDN